MDHRNQFRETIEGDGVVLGARSTTFSPTVIETFGLHGVDFIWLDFEHTGRSPYDSKLFEDLTRAAEIGGTELLVRLPSGDPPLVRKTLDAGVRNLLIPRVDSAEEVREAVEASRFEHDGKPGERGMASGRSKAWGHTEDYVAKEERSVCLGVMIEKTTAIDDLEEVLQVPDLGFIFVGPADLAVQMGHPGDKDHPDVREQIETIRTACLSADVPIGAISHDPPGARTLIEEGYQIVRIGGELEAATKTIDRRLDAVQSER